MMPALPFSNSMGLAPNLTDMRTWPDGSVFHHGRTACCLVVDWRSPLTLVQRWTVRTWLGSFRSSFCSSSLVMNLVRRCWIGSFVVLGSKVNESDLRTAIWVLRCWINPPDHNAMACTVHANCPPRPHKKRLRYKVVSAQA